jgi:tRNA (guanine6-N2)-methyltransferase
MNDYFSTFVAGFEKTVEKRLPIDLFDVKIAGVMEGLVVYETSLHAQRVGGLRYLNNSFFLLRTYEHSSLEEAALFMLKDNILKTQIINKIKRVGKSFRIIFSNENKIVSFDNKTTEIEKMLINAVRVDKANPDTELWFIKRREGAVYLGLRITRPGSSDKHLQKGQLRHQIAHLLCLLSEPSKDDIVLDPFAGYGAIVLEMVLCFPYKKVMAGEKDKQVFRLLQEKLKSKKNVVVGRWDATNLSSLTNGSVSKIVTDPPWGIYSNKEDVGEVFYQRVLEEFSRIMIRGGLAVILTGQKSALEKVLNNIDKFILLEKCDVLVSGKKAGVYKLKKL